MVTKQTVIECLRERDMGTKEFQDELGKWPRKTCSLLEEAGSIERYRKKKNGRIWFRLVEDDEELEEAIKRNAELIEEKKGLWSRFVNAFKH